MAIGNFVKRLGRPRTEAPDPSDSHGALARADALAAADDVAGAVDVLAATWTRTNDPSLEIPMRDYRVVAGAAPVGADVGREPWPPRYDDPFPDARGTVVEIDGDRLSTDIVGGAVAHHGALCVRGLFDPEQVRRTLDVLHAARARQAEGVADRHYLPMREDKATLRDHVRQHGGTWLADSPSATAVVFHELGASRVVDVVSEHFGERPHFSLEKSTLRRTPPEDRITGWHQDGSFLGAEVRTMNVWIALSSCGGGHAASGLEVIPHRLDELLPKDPALGNAGVSFDLMDELLADTPSVKPEFEPGDALIFDERFMHRTALGPDLTEDRYALECWFFAPSHATSDYTPLLV